MQSGPSDIKHHLSDSKYTIHKEHQNASKFLFKCGMTSRMTTCMGDKTGACSVVVNGRGERDNLGDPGVDGTIILKMNLQ